MSTNPYKSSEHTSERREVHRSRLLFVLNLAALVCVALPLLLWSALTIMALFSDTFVDDITPFLYVNRPFLISGVIGILVLYFVGAVYNLLAAVNRRATGYVGLLLTVVSLGVWIVSFYLDS